MNNVQFNTILGEIEALLKEDRVEVYDEEHDIWYPADYIEISKYECEDVYRIIPKKVSFWVLIDERNNKIHGIYHQQAEAIKADKFNKDNSNLSIKYVSE